MKTSKFTDEQIPLALRQAEAGTPVGEICRKLSVSGQTFCRWKKRFGALGVSEVRELRQPKPYQASKTYTLFPKRTLTGISSQSTIAQRSDPGNRTPSGSSRRCVSIPFENRGGEGT